MPIACPTGDQIAGFLVRGAPAGLGEAWIEHLSACTVCQGEMDRLGAAMPSPPLFSPPEEARDRAGEVASLARRIVDCARGAVLERNSEGGLGQIGRYRLTRTLGAGGMGDVFEATDPVLNRAVAIKTIQPQVFSGETLKRLRAEATTLAGLTHPNIVGIYEQGEHLGVPFLAMELVRGQSLSERLVRGPLCPEGAARLIATLARALDYVHQRGVLHRDLKPSNILLGESGEPAHTEGGAEWAAWQPRLIDFGLSKQVGSEPMASHSGAVLGTPAYMAPEQTGDDRYPVDRRSDIYGLGAVLYHCLTGQPPFPSDSAANTLQMICHMEPPPPRLFSRAIPRDLETICLKCLGKEPSGRYPSAEELAEDLDRFLAGVPILARPAGRMERLGRWILRHRLLSLALASVAVSIAGSVVLAISFAWREAQLRAVADMEKSRANSLLEETLQGHQRVAMDMLTISLLLRPGPNRTLETTRDAIRGALMVNSRKLVEDFRRHPELADRYPDWLAEVLFAQVRLCREAGEKNAEVQAAGELLEIIGQQENPAGNLLNMELDLSVLVGRAWIQDGRGKETVELWTGIWRHRQGLSPDFLKANPRTRQLLETLGVTLAELLRNNGNDPEAYERVRRELAGMQQQSKQPE